MISKSSLTLALSRRERGLSRNPQTSLLVFVFLIHQQRSAFHILLPKLFRTVVREGGNPVLLFKMQLILSLNAGLVGLAGFPPD
jgi:hypothetical protein